MRRILAAILVLVSSTTAGAGRRRFVPSFTLEQITQVRTLGQWAIAPSGNRVAYAVSGFYLGFPVIPKFGEDNNIRVVALDSGETIQATSGLLPKTAPVFSPRGDRLAFDSEDDIWSMDLASGAVARLTTHGSSGRPASWSPDGAEIAFVSNDLGQSAIWIMSADGEGHGLRRATPGSTLSEDDPQWSPDGRMIAFTATATDEHYYASGIYTVAPAGGTPTRLTPKDNSENSTARWSPDGAHLAFLSDRSGFVHVWVMNPDGSGARELNTGLHDSTSPHWRVKPMWSPDGRQVLVSVNRDGSFDLVAISIADGRVETLETGPGQYHEVGWRSDGTVVYAYENAWSPPDLYVRERHSGRVRRLTHSADLHREAMAWATRVSIQSADGMTVYGVLLTPRDHQPDEVLPAIVALHPNSYGQFSDQWNPFFEYLAQSGYVVLLLDQRGSSGYGRAFRDAAVGAWGTKTFEDVQAAAAFIKSRRFVDASRVGVMGLSFGGYQALLAATKTPGLFRAVVDLMGPTDRRPPFANRNTIFHVGATPEQNPVLYDRISPITSVAALRVPLLVIHSDSDRNVPLQQTRNLLAALEQNHKVYEVIIYEREAHGLADPVHQLDSYRRIVRFFDRYLR